MNFAANVDNTCHIEKEPIFLLICITLVGPEVLAVEVEVVVVVVLLKNIVKVFVRVGQVVFRVAY